MGALKGWREIVSYFDPEWSLEAFVAKYGRELRNSGIVFRKRVGTGAQRRVRVYAFPELLREWAQKKGGKI